MARGALGASSGYVTVIVPTNVLVDVLVRHVDRMVLATEVDCSVVVVLSMLVTVVVEGLRVTVLVKWVILPCGNTVTDVDKVVVRDTVTLVLRGS